MKCRTNPSCTPSQFGTAMVLQAIRILSRRAPQVGHVVASGKRWGLRSQYPLTRACASSRLGLNLGWGRACAQLIAADTVVASGLLSITHSLPGWVVLGLDMFHHFGGPALLALLGRHVGAPPVPTAARTPSGPRSVACDQPPTAAQAGAPSTRSTRRHF